MKYKIWNRQDSINGVDASHFLNQNPFKKYNGDIILIYNEDKIVSVECKDILANVYQIDPALPLDDFMNEYFKKLEPEETDEKIEEEQ